MGFFKGLEMGGIYLKVEWREAVLGQGRVVTSLRSSFLKLGSIISSSFLHNWETLSPPTSAKGCGGCDTSSLDRMVKRPLNHSTLSSALDTTHRSFLNHRFSWLPDNSLSWLSVFLTGPSFSSPWPLNVKCYRFYPRSTSQSPVLSRRTHPISWP